MGSFQYKPEDIMKGTPNASVNASIPLTDNNRAQPLGAYFRLPYRAGNASDHQGAEPVEATVEMYTVIVCTIAMLIFGAIGLLSNLALLVCTKCKKSIRHIQYGLPYCLAAVNVFFCLSWVPLEIFRLILNYCEVGLHPMLCHLDIALFYFCMGTLVFINIFIAIQRILKFLAISLIQSAYIMAGICVSAALGIIFATGVSMDYERTVDYRICTQTWPQSSIRLSIAAIAVNTLWVLVLLIICSSLFVVVILQRKGMANQQKLRACASLTKDYSCPKPKNDDLEEAKQRFLNSIPEGGNKPQPLPKKKVAKNVSIDFSIKKKLKFGDSTKKGSDSENSENDEDYEARMKVKLQKSLSGRRHTVANIGLGESSFGGRRGSMEAKKSPGSAGYSYVRKWSVDIQALQDQLENPKAYLSASASGALTTLSDKNTNKSKSTSSTKITESITEETHAEAENSADSVKSENDQKTNEKSVQESSMDDSIIAVAEDPLPTEKKDSPSKEGEPTSCGDNVANGNPNDHMSGVESSVNDNVDDDCQPVLDKREMIQSLQVNAICLLLMLTVLTCILPFALLQFLQISMVTNLNRNLTWILAGFCVIQTPIHTVLVAWMERKLWNGLRRLRVKLTHWRCVCYCNVGKGKRCFGRPDRPIS